MEAKERERKGKRDSRKKEKKNKQAVFLKHKTTKKRVQAAASRDKHELPILHPFASGGG